MKTIAVAAAVFIAFLDVASLAQQPASPAKAPSGAPGTQDFQKLRPAPLPYQIERKMLGGSEFFKRVEFFWVASPAKPRAFLIMATNMGRPQAPLEDPNWVKFAHQQGLGILSVGLSDLDQPGRLQDGARALADHIQQIVAEKFGPNLRGSVIAGGLGATWMHRVMMERPWQWGFWCTRDVNRYPLIPRGIDYPAGLLLCTDSVNYDQNFFFFQDLRRAKATNRVGFVALDGKAVAPSHLDRMAQNYLLAVFSGTEAPGRWYDVHSEADIATLTKTPPPGSQNWIPGDEMAGAWKMLHMPHKKTPECVVATADVTLPNLAGPLKVFFRIPGKTHIGVPVRSVQIWCTWEPTDDNLYDQLQKNSDLKSALWDREAIGVIALNMKSLGFNENLTEPEAIQLQKMVKGVTPHFWKTASQACSELGWSTGQCFLLGSRSGTVFAQEMALSSPKQFPAVHLHAGKSYLKVMPQPDASCWLVTSGLQDPGYEESLSLYRRLKNAGLPVLFKAPNAAGGNSEDWLHALGIEFFATVKTFSEQIKKDATPGKQGSPATAAERFLGAVGKSIAVADVTNDRFGKIAGPNAIPPLNRVVMPTWELEDSWSVREAPKPPPSDMAPGSSGKPPVLASPQPTSPPRKP